MPTGALRVFNGGFGALAALYRWAPLALIMAVVTGCGNFIARRIAQAPNTYPTWLAPEAPVTLDFSPKFLTNFPARTVNVGPPQARLRYRVVNPADFHLRVFPTNWIERGRSQFEFKFRADIPGPTNKWSAAPRGTVFLLHGYGLSQFAMAPWALSLAEEGWRCVLVDLRGHGKSTGRRIYFGIEETRDLSLLLDDLERGGKVAAPVAALGESYGAALALRWKASDPRVGPVVAIAPYASLSNAVLNIRREYAGWFPEFLIKSGLKKLPGVLKTPPDNLDITTVLQKHMESALFAVGDDDRITPLPEVVALRDLGAPGSRLMIVPKATHESVNFFLNDLLGPVTSWLEDQPGGTRPAAKPAPGPSP